MKTVVFVTGNEEKVIDASGVCRDYGIALEQSRVQVDEIQHRDPRKITAAKAKAAYSRLRRPIVVNDSAWNIPALNGFPGGYMKDVNEWLSEEDFLALMASKSDRSIMLHETVAYYDGDTYKEFIEIRPGRFLDSATDLPGTSLGNVVTMDCDDGMSINQVFAKRRAGEYPVLAANYTHWQKFAEWYSKYNN